MLPLISQLLIFFTMWFLPSAGKAESKKGPNSYGEPIITSEGIEIVYSEDAMVKAKFTAAKSLQYENKDIIYPLGVYVIFYSNLDKKPDKDLENKKKSYPTLKADRVHFYAEQSLYELEGNIELVNPENQEMLRTEKLYWSPEKEIVYTDRLVRIETKDVILLGEGFTSNQDLTRYSIEKPRGVLSIDKSQKDQTEPMASESDSTSLATGSATQETR